MKIEKSVKSLMSNLAHKTNEWEGLEKHIIFYIKPLMKVELQELREYGKSLVYKDTTGCLSALHKII